MKMKKLLLGLTLGSVVLFAACEKDTYEEKVGVCPLVVSTIPTDKAIDVPLNQIISATFNETMNSSTINQTTFLLKQGATAVSGTVAPATGESATSTFTPASPLAPFTVYTGTIKKGVKDPMNNALQEDYVWSFTTKPQLTLSAIPVIGGTVTGGGLYNAGTSVTATAVASAGYVFANWTEAGVIASTNATYTFPLAGNRTLVANFTAQYSVTLSSLPLAGGTTTGGGLYNSGASVTISAVPAVGYTFTNWTEGTTVLSALKDFTFPLTANKVLVANFAINMYTLNVTAPNGTVVKNPNQATFSHGTSVQLTATPNAGYTFTSWSGDATGTTSPVTVIMNSNKNVTANFTAIVVDTYTLNVTAVNGTVLKVPSKTAYNSGEIVVLTATPATGYTFTGWTGDATGSINPVSVTMNSNKNVTANFTAVVPNTFTLNVIAVNGTVLKNPNLVFYPSGSNVELTATANPGFTFTGWTGDATGSINPVSVTMNSNKNVTANFTADVTPPTGPAPVNLGTAGDFSILTMSGISSTGVTAVEGDIGVSPAAASAITGFGLIMNTDGQSSHTTIATHVTGKVYASDYDPPTPSKLTVAVADMLTAYTTANNLVTPAPVLEKGAGNLSGLTLAPGIYKWSTGVLIAPDATVTLSGGANDTWVFQIAQDLTLDPGAKVNLIGGAQAKNITWVVAGQAVLGTNTVLYGSILSKTLISLNTGSKVTGKLLAQTAVTLNTSTVVKP